MTDVGAHTPPSITALGDSALTVTLGNRIDRELAGRVRDLATRIRAAQLKHVEEVVVGYTALTVWYDALHVDYDKMVQAINPIAAADAGPGAMASEPPEHVIPVTYDGPDLAEVAERTGLTATEVVQRHSQRVYDVYLVGFVPGWAYLGDLDPALVLPRRAIPRTRVPAGSVGIAGAQTGVYPLATPGGWHLIGRTSVVLFDPAADPPAKLAAGDRVRFVPTPT